MDLEHLETRGMSAAYRGAIGSEERFLVALTDRPRPEPAFAERLARGANDIPGFFAALDIRWRERPVAVPRARHARLAAGVRELDGRQRALRAHELGDAGEPRNVGVVPDARIAVRDAAARLHCGRLDEHDARAALGELAEVHQVPVGHMAFARRVLAHRRNDDAVTRLHPAQLDRLKQQRRIRGQGRNYFFFGQPP